jgi:hypothetical protein
MKCTIFWDTVNHPRDCEHKENITILYPPLHPNPFPTDVRVHSFGKCLSVQPIRLVLFL